MGIAVSTARQPLIIHARFYTADFTNGRGRNTVFRVAVLIDDFHKPLPYFLITGKKCRAQQRLHLPGLAPLSVVTVKAFNSAHNRTGATFRTQAQIDLQRRVTGGFGETGSHLIDDPYRPLQRFWLFDTWGRLGCDHDISIGAKT